MCCARLDSELVAAVGITPANAPEASVAEAIKGDLKQQQITLQQLHIDRAYLSSTLVRERAPELEIFCKAWPVRAGAFFPKTAFVVDWERQMLRCPQGIEMDCQPRSNRAFPPKDLCGVSATVALHWE
jgi:transposase